MMWHVASIMGKHRNADLDHAYMIIDFTSEITFTMYILAGLKPQHVRSPDCSAPF